MISRRDKVLEEKKLLQTKDLEHKKGTLILRPNLGVIEGQLVFSPLKYKSLFMTPEIERTDNFKFSYVSIFWDVSNFKVSFQNQIFFSTELRRYPFWK